MCARFCFGSAALCATVKIYLWSQALSGEEPSQDHWAAVAIAILGIVAISSGVTAVVLRFTEKPRETTVHESADQFEPPFVIHVRHE